MYWEAGFTATGLIASRPDDVLGIGYAHAGISDDASAQQVANNESVILDYEGLLEVSYTAQIVPGFTIQPDFQYFWNPGGHAADPMIHQRHGGEGRRRVRRALHHQLLSQPATAAAVGAAAILR